MGGEVNDTVTASEGCHDLTVIGGVNHHGMGRQGIVTSACGQGAVEAFDLVPLGYQHGDEHTG
jgi:hypothetical protein